MKKFIYHLNSPLGTKFKQKRVEVEAEDSRAADEKIKTDFPRWQVSMFRQVWEPKKEIKIESPAYGFTGIFNPNFKF